MVDLEVHLMGGEDLRAMVTDISPFKALIFPSKSQEVIGAGKADSSSSQAEVHAFLSRVSWDTAALIKNTNKLLRLMMDTSSFAQSRRLSDDLGTRLISMSAFSWNQESQSKSRDYGPIAIASALEAALIPLYRNELILSSTGAAELRREIFSLFSNAALPRVRSAGADGYVQEWAFADDIPLPIASTLPVVRDYDALTARWEAAHSGGSAFQADPALSLLKSLRKNKYLFCSTPGVPVGTLETLAHDHINSLVEVCRVGILVSFLFDSRFLRLSPKINIVRTARTL